MTTINSTINEPPRTPMFPNFPSELPPYGVYAENEKLKEENERLKAELAEAGNLVKHLTNSVRWLQEHIAKIAQPLYTYITIEESGL